MNTILISGTAKINSINKVEYDVNVYAAKENEPLEYIRSLDKILDGYNDLWKLAKDTVEYYYNIPKFQDGAYTQYLDHLIII